MTRFNTIALDIDGTLLTSDHIITAKTQYLLQQLKSQLQILLVTGRHHQMALPIYQQLQLTTPMICANGAYIYHPESHKISGKALEKSDWQEILRLSELYQFDVMCHFSAGIGHNPDNIHVIKVSSYIDSFFTLSSKPIFLSSSSLESLCAEQPEVWKIELHGKDEPSVQTFLSEASLISSITIDQTGPLSLEIVSHGCSKGHRLAEYLESSGFDVRQTIAFGDNFNDLSMFKQVGCGVAMGNAHEIVQQHAHYVTSSNDNSGIVDGLRNFWEQLDLK